MASKRRGNQSGWVAQLKSGRWQARFLGPDGVRRPAPATFDTRMDADAWLTRQVRMVEFGTWADDAGTVSGSFADFAATWMADRDLKPSTRAHYTKIIDQHLLPAFGTMPLEAITVATIKSWYKGTTSMKPTIRAHTYGLMHAILHTAWQEDLIPSNPCRIRGAGNTKRATSTDVPTAVQVHALADEMGITHNNDKTIRVLSGGKYKVMTLVAAWCGLRFGEVTELRRKDVVLEGGVPVRLRVHRGVVRVDGEFVVQSPKSSAGRRDVSIPPHVRADVAAYLEGLPAGAETLLFPGSRNGSHMAPSALYKPFYRAREAVGLPSLRWHDLRHFSATTAAQTGATLAELQSRLGHSTTQAAMRYQHTASGRDEQIAAAMSDNVVPIRRGA